MQTKPWYSSLTLWVNVLSIVAVGIGTGLQLAGQLALTTQQVAIATIVLAVVNAAIRIIGTNKPISGSPAAHRLARELVVRHLQQG